MSIFFSPAEAGRPARLFHAVVKVLTVDAGNNYEYLIFEDLKPAGFEAVQIRSGRNVLIRELKSGGLPDQLEHRAGGPAPLQSEPFWPGSPNAEDSRYTGRSRSLHQELRDRKVVLFADRLPQGFWEISYEMRAEVPGIFHALPVTGQAMYIPEIRANGVESRIEVTEPAVSPSEH